MQLAKLFAVLLLLAVVNCDYWYEGNSIHYSYLPTTSLGNFEGSYTSKSHLGFGLNICQDDNKIYGSYDQLGIFNGNVTGDKASGNWYQAGSSNCSSGSFQIQLNSVGFTGTYTCAGTSNSKFNFTETKLQPFRPSNSDCALMDLSGTSTLSGRFEDDFGLAKDFCNSKATGVVSFLYLDNDDVAQKAYFEGVSHANGKVFTGTWYTLAPEAGAALYYLDESGAVYAYFWTGLEGTDGTTVINPAQYRQSIYHNVETYTGPVSATASKNCTDYSTIKTKVLLNLVPDYNDDDLYYFVTSDFNNVVDDDGYDDDGYVDDEDVVSSDATSVYWCILPLLLALLF